MPPTLIIIGLEWTEERERHVERHIRSWEVEDLIEGGDYVAFPNTEGHPPGRWKLIGRTSSGHFVTAILQEPPDRDPTRWIPVTGWPATDFERRMYAIEVNRLNRKRGHG